MSPLLATLFAGSAWLMYSGLFGGSDWDERLRVSFILCGLAIGIIAMIFGFRLFRYRIEIFRDHLDIQGAFLLTRVPFKDVEGIFHHHGNGLRHLTLARKKNRYGNVEIHPRIGNAAGFETWAASRFKDLDAENAADLLAEIDPETERLAADLLLDESVEVRRGKVKRVQKQARNLCILAIVASAWWASIPMPYSPLAALVIALPWFALLFARWHHEHFRPPSSSRAAIVSAIILPSLSVLARGMMDWRVLEWASFWWLFFAVSWVFAGAFVVLFPHAGRLRAWILISALAYGFGTIRVINGVLDHSLPQIRKVPVLAKWERRAPSGRYSSGGRHRLRIGPWGPRRTAQKLRVHGDLYRMLDIGDSIKIKVHKGRLGIPWYTIQRSPPGYPYNFFQPFD